MCRGYVSQGYVSRGDKSPGMICQEVYLSVSICLGGN